MFQQRSLLLFVYKYFVYKYFEILTVAYRPIVPIVPIFRQIVIRDAFADSRREFLEP